MSLLFAFLAFAQVGPFSTPGPQPVSPLPPEIVDRKARESAARRSVPAVVPPPTVATPGVQACPSMDNPVDAADASSAWLAKAQGAEQATAGECLGVALSMLGRWDEALAAFSAAREVADTPVWRARLGAMAGEAALYAGDAAGALAALDAAVPDAAADTVMAGGIAVYRARALVALGREAEAASALSEARGAVPGDPQAWLLSATLSRRMNRLAEAQAQIERAAELMPVDPAVGLEAGVIAVLSGRDAAARKSWQSVIDAAPKSDAAATAKGYLDQLAETTPVTP